MLFHRFNLCAALEERENKLTRSVESVPASEILSKSPEQLADELFDAFRVDPPVLRESDIQVSQEEAQVDVSQDPMRFIRDRGRPFYLPGTNVSFHVPFDGDVELFGAQPSQFLSNLPHADVRDGELVFSYQRRDHDANAVKAEFERELASVRNYLSWVRNDVAPFNESLRTKAKQRIERRREKLLKDQGMVSQIGYPLRRREGAPRTYTVPAARRRPRVARSARGSKPFVPEPALELVYWFSVKMTARLDVNATPGGRMSPIAPGIVPECSGASRVKRAARAGFAALDAPCALWYSMLVGERERSGAPGIRVFMRAPCSHGAHAAASEPARVCGLAPTRSGWPCHP